MARKNRNPAAVVLVILFICCIPLNAEYLFGILPQNRDYQQVLELWEEYKRRYVTVSGNTADGGHWEYHAFAMVFAAYFEEDQTLFSKLWNTVEPGVEWNGPLWRKYKAADVLIDIGMALDRAAVRWGGKWENLAERWIKRFEHKLGPYWDICGCWDNPTGSKMNQLHCGAINGDACGHYINYYALSHFFRFDQRTGKDLWMSSVMDACFYTLEHAYEVNKLPPWYVRMQDIDNDGEAEGVQVLPNDMNYSRNPDKWDGGATRSGWRLPFAYIAFGTPWSLKWARKMYDFYKSKTDNPTSLSYYRPSTGVMYGGPAQMLSVCGAGVIAMAVGDQEWADAVWAYLVDPVRKRTASHQKDAQRLYCLLKMSGKFDVYGDAEYVPEISTKKALSISRPGMEHSRPIVFIGGRESGRNAAVFPYLSVSKPVAIYDLQGTVVGFVHDKASFSKLQPQLPHGKFIMRR